MFSIITELYANLHEEKIKGKIMTTTIKRRSFCVTKQIEKEIIHLMDHFGETQSSVIQRAIQHLYYTMIQCDKFDKGVTEKDHGS